MKKIFNSIIIFASFALLIILGLSAVNDALVAAGMSGFISMEKYGTVINFLRNYGPLIIVASLVFVNFIAKSFIKIVFLILFLLAFAVYIFATSFPEQLTKLFGI